MAHDLDPDAFWSPRSNPPVRALPRDVAMVVAAQRGLLSSLGAKPFGRPLGCGANGCAIEAKASNAVIKVTKDRDEVKLVEAISRIRLRQPPHVPQAKRLALARIGTTPEEVSRLPGFVLVKGEPRRMGDWFAYKRELLQPIDALRGKSARRLVGRVRKAIDGFFYEGRWKDPVRFMAIYPELRTITRTVLGLLWVYGINTEDIHEQQVGRVIHGTKRRPRGTLVLYDGQVIGRLPRSITMRRNPECGCPRLV